MEQLSLKKVPPGKVAGGTTGPGEEVKLARSKKSDEAGLVGFVNIGNSCYMNATLQALSNCPPFCQYFVDTFQPSPSSSSLPSPSAAAALSTLFRKVWSSERPPGHLSPRSVTSAMKNRTFKGSQQQDAQEFLRCLLTQIHEELGLQAPPPEEGSRGCGQRESMMSCDSDTSAESQCSQSRLVGSARNSPLIKKRSNSSSSLSRLKLPGSTHSSPASQSKFSKYNKINTSPSAKNSTESIPTLACQGAGSRVSLEQQEEGVEWEEGDVFVADIIDGSVKVHRNYFQSQRVSTTKRESANRITCIDDSLPSESSGEVSNDEETGTGQGHTHSSEASNTPHRNGKEQKDSSGGTSAATAGQALPTGGKVSLRHTGPPGYPHTTTSIVSEVFEGILESRVKCLKCKKISETREPFQDLSLPIPGRKEIAKFTSKQEGSGGEAAEPAEEAGSISRGWCSMWNYLRDFFLDPPTDLDNCLSAFFDTSSLKGENRYYCKHCRSFQDSLKEMSIVKLPEVLCIHLKRFRYDAYISTNKISRHIKFPLTELSMGSYLKHGSLEGNHLYDLNAVITHYGGAGAGHYVAFAKNSVRNSWYEFNDTRVYPISSDAVLSAEGYVLFYRRVNPGDSRQANVPSLLPPPGTVVPSPDICYISRHWLHLMRHHTSPGAIFQHDYACQHGAVLPTLSVEDARSLALCVRREAWEELQRGYGGGPLVQQLEICKNCKELLIQLNKRRKVETEEVQKVHLKERKGMEEKKEHFLIFLPWIQQWQKFIHCTTLERRPPVAIDNTALLQYCGTNGKRTLTLCKGAPFKRVSQEVWELFQGLYGGGPVIVTSLEPFKNHTH